MSRTPPPKRPRRAASARPAAAKKPRKTTGKARKPAPRRAPRRKAPPRRPTRGGILSWPGRFLRWVLRLIWGIGWRVGLFLALILGAAVWYTYTTLPEANELLDGRTRGSVTFLDRSGEVFAWRGDQFGGGIASAAAAPNLKNAVVATEDRRFYRHLGVDPIGIIGAMRINMREGRGPLQGHGGSTITQQTAKLLCVGQPYDPASGQSEAEYEAACREGSLKRKAREALYALAMEVKYSKDEILTIYMNRAYLGAGTRGFEAASQRYFGKPASAVSPAEAAMLAGLLVAPTRYAPTTNLARSQERARVIVGLMERQGYLSAEEAGAARANPARLSAAAASRSGGYFADWVIRDEVPPFWGTETTEDVVLGTTLDLDLQIAAEAALAEIFRTKVRAGSKAEAAIVILDPSGAVRAMVGGRQADVPGGFNRAVQAKRQTGSAFKPFVYATALEMGYSYRDLVEDAPLTINVPGSGPWSPKNYTRDYKGIVTLTKALAESLNTPAVRVSEAVGRDLVRQVAADFGIESDLAAGPALALGTSEATLLETTAAFAGILNGGRSVRPFGVTELRLFGEAQAPAQSQRGIGERVISERAAQELTFMMHQVVEAGTGGRAKLPGRPVAGKTGTTQAARDAWFVGFTGDFVAGVWMGYDDNTPLSGVTGGGLPAEIWQATMLRVHEGLPPTPLPMAVPQDGPQRLVEGPSPQAPVRVVPAPGEGQVVPPSAARSGRDGPSLGERILRDVRGLFGRN